MKRLNFRSSFAFAMLLALILPILAACGGGTPAASPAATTAASNPTSAPAAEATAAPAAEEATEAPADTAETAAPSGDTATNTGSAEPGVLRINVGAESDNYDPQQASFVGEIQWIMLNYQALMTFDLEMQPIPGQAESVELSEDGKVYTFKLRPDSKYSDGTPLTAENFEYAWKRLADPTLAGQYQSLPCGIIEGYSEYAAVSCPDAEGNTATITDVESMDLEALREGVGVNAIDDQTLEIRLVNPAPFFLSMAALWIGAPVKEESAAEIEGMVRADPAVFIGNGPFMLVEHEPDVGARWEKNPNYQGPLGPVKLNEIRMVMINDSQVAFQAYKNGELDVVGVAAEDLAAVEADPVLSKEMRDTLTSCTFYLGFNIRQAPFDNIKVRQAFAQALNREAWVDDILQGLGAPTQTFIPPGFPGYEESDKWAFDPEAAKATLAEAGYADGAELGELKLTFSSSARNQVRYEWLASQFKQVLNVDILLDPVDPTAYTGLLKDENTIPLMFILGWCADYPDPQNWLTTVFKTGGVSGGRVGWSNAEFDRLTAEADVETDPEQRAELYSQAQDILIEEAPVAFFWNDPGKQLIKPYVTGVEETPLDYIPGFFNLANLEVNP